jgi:hypothetical protein
VTDLLDQAMVDAGLNLLRADSGLTVYDGATPPKVVRPYVLVYTFVERPGDDTSSQALDGLTTRTIVRWYCHCVGDTQMASRAVAQRVRTQLLDQRPTIAGLSCGFIREDQADPPVKDEQVGQPVFDSLAVYRMTVDS